MQAQVPGVKILGVRIARLDAEGALAHIKRLGEGASPALIAYVNAHSLNLASKNPAYRKVLSDASLVLNDGSGLGIAGRLLRNPFPENLNGSDFNPRILELAAREGWPVYLLGARPGVAGRASERLTKSIPTLDIAGTHDGYFSADRTDQVVDDIRASGAGVLMVAMGNPTQELWLRDHLAVTGARLGVGVGAFFDFAAGEVPRAPAWMTRVGIEWLYRLRQEPRRMWRRYLVGNPVFLARVVRDLASRKTS